MSTGSARRITSVDVLRGLVVLLLVPDIQGGFSLREMANLYPDNRLWATLGAQFSHVDWIGFSLWDLVMPAFVFLVGVSMAITVARQREEGASPRRLLVHAVLRSMGLFVLGMALGMERRTSVLLELLPYAIVVGGLPWARWADSWTGTPSAPRTDWLSLGLPAIAAVAIGGLLVARPTMLGAYDFTSILTLLGLAYLPSYLLVQRGPRFAVGAALLVLVLYAIAFSLYPTPGNPGRWSNGSNVADALDMWLLNALPRTEPYTGNPHGYHTLQFVPMIASMVFGALVGNLLVRPAADPTSLAAKLTLAALGAIAAAGACAAIGIPLVKSLWTPTWVLFSSALCFLTLALLSVAFDRPGCARFVVPLTVLGTNALLLYTVSYVHRWRIVMYGERLLGEAVTLSPWRPLLQSLIVLVVLWLLAWWLHHQRIRVHI